MKMERVNIEINDNRRFADVALLVDKEQFLKNVSELRPILELPIEISDYGKWVKRSEREELSNAAFQKAVEWITKQPDCEYADYSNKKHVDVLTVLQHDHHKVFKEKFPISKIVNLFASFLCKRYKKNTNFRPVIRMALILNRVTDSEYETTILKLFPPTPPLDMDYEPDGKEFFTQPKYFGLALYFLPNTPMKELVKILDRDLPKLQNAYKDLILGRQDIDIQTQDVIPNIKWYRDWYWLHNLHSYQQIVNLEAKKSTDKRIQGTISRDRVIQGIKAYKKLLTTMET